MRARRLLPLALLALAGCRSETAPSPPDPQVAAAATPAPRGAGRADLRDATSETVFDHLRTSGAKLTVVNFWATWCVPCVQEFPELVRAGQTLKPEGVDLVFVSADFPDLRDSVTAYLDRQGVTGVSFLKTGPDDPFIAAFDSSWSGTMPTTFIYDAAGRRRFAHQGKVTEALVVDTARALLRSL